MTVIVDIYCRISTEAQDDNTSLDEQERAGREYCEDHGLIVGMVHRETYTGFKYRERKKLSLMRERYQTGVIQGVVFRTYDRLARRAVHQAILLEEMEHLEVEVHCSHEQLDDTFEGKMTRMLLGLLAEYEWEKIRERTMTGLRNKALEGVYVTGRKLPYGWQFTYDDKGNRQEVIHEPEQVKHIRWMADEYGNKGTSTIDIAKSLNERKIHTPLGDENTQWHPVMIRRILSNHKLIGKAQVFGNYPSVAKHQIEPVELPDGTFPAIISEELFWKIQDRLARNKDEATRKSAQPEEFLLRAGYLFCGMCGRKMHTRIDRDKRNKTTYERFLYRCRPYDGSGNYVCEGQEFRAEVADQWVMEQLLLLAEHTELIAQAIQLARSAGAVEADVKALDASITLWEQKAQNYLEDLDDPTLRGDSRATIRHSLNLANQHLEQLRFERSQVLLGMIDREREKQAYEDILAWCQTVKEARGELSYQRKRDFLHMMGIMVIADRDQDGMLDLSMEIALPEIKELITSAIRTEEQHRSILCGKGRRLGRTMSKRFPSCARGQRRVPPGG